MSLDWHELFGSSIGVLELVARGTSMYWFLFLIFRVILRRNVGSIAIADVLLLVIIADASQNAMAGEYTSVTDGFVLVGTIVFWNYMLDLLAYRWKALRRFLEPPPLLLVRDGQLLRQNMRRELVTEDELLAQLRQQGVDKLQQVKRAFMESDGSVTVIQHRKT